MFLSEYQHQISEAYAWHRALGNDVAEGSHCRFVTRTDTPDIWVANHVQFPRADSLAEIETMLAQMDVALAHCSHRMLLIDPDTPQLLIAQLLARGYYELDSTVQMLLAGPIEAAPVASLTFRTIESDADWATYFRLSRADHEEGKKSFGLDLDEEVTRGLMADVRRKADHMTFYLAEKDGEPVAFGAGVDCPNGMGMIEDLFTLPSHRGQGIISALIAHAAAALRANDPERPIFLGALAQQGAKHLYLRLGFEPVLVTRELILRRS